MKKQVPHTNIKTEGHFTLVILGTQILWTNELQSLIVE